VQARRPSATDVVRGVAEPEYSATDAVRGVAGPEYSATGAVGWVAGRAQLWVSHTEEATGVGCPSWIASCSDDCVIEPG